MLAKYIFTLIPLAVIDAIWLSLIAKAFYAKHMGFLFSKNINIIPVAIFYPLYAIAILVLAVSPAITDKSWLAALTRGAILGAAAYGAYDLTNQATIAKWPTIMTIVDLTWGITLTALTSLLAYFLITRLHF